MAAAWEDQRRQTRACEARVDSALNRFSRLAADLSKRQSSTGPQNDMDNRSDQDNEGLEHEIEKLLADLSASVSALATALDKATAPPSASQMHAIQRHRDVLADFRRDYARTKTAVRHNADRQALLGDIRVDIDKYKNQHASDAEALLAERNYIDNSHRMLDGTLEQAYAARADVASQRVSLQNILARVHSTADQVPGLNNLIRLISRRRRRDSIIMGCVIGICTIILILFATN